MDGPHAPEPNLYVAWYEAWRAEQEARREAQAAARRQMQREIRWMVYALLVWAAAAGVAGAIALALWTGA
ncbi:hypothetical protein [Lichenibacterium dinghuense]|uniref:hypothetical protein n=1 Tax=Lichenibacterium dinghuense TaxID=2895977 RepID=UPI001F481C35|nr:hypothetical protein [Lichenibacterium sp. 6Y81]